MLYSPHLSLVGARRRANTRCNGIVGSAEENGNRAAFSVTAADNPNHGCDCERSKREAEWGTCFVIVFPDVCKCSLPMPMSLSPLPMVLYILLNRSITMYK